MAEKKGKRLPGIVAAGFLVFAVPTAVLAAGGSGRTENIKSHGVIEYKGQSDTVRIDSSDLVYLAKEIDAVEKAAKWGSVQALKAIGTELGIEEENRVSDISFSDINNAIRNSQATDAAPSPDEIVSGKEVWANGIKITGTMASNGILGAVDLKAGVSYQIPAGYSEGGEVTTASLESQTQASATAQDILSGQTAWVNGVLITGTHEAGGGNDVKRISINLHSMELGTGDGDLKLVLTRVENGAWECSRVRHTDQGEELQEVAVGKVEIED
ncbi:MAG: hypothetical protein HFI95_10430 [Lachnospiraceae bacterium]|jgi:hypothetical protein|nr:hypothetical protein [Lachnospiraceae bacterium]